MKIRVCSRSGSFIQSCLLQAQLRDVGRQFVPCAVRRNSSARKEEAVSACAKRLLLVWHSRTGLARQMADALEEGALAAARDLEVSERLHIAKRAAHEASVEDLLRADGYLFCAPENLATVSGAMLEFFHRSYYHAFEADHHGTQGYFERSLLLGRPYGLAIAAGSDGSGAAKQVTRICQGWRLRPVMKEPLIVRNGLPQTACSILAPKGCSPEAQRECSELGGLLAATLFLQEYGSLSSPCRSVLQYDEDVIA